MESPTEAKNSSSGLRSDSIIAVLLIFAYFGIMVALGVGFWLRRRSQYRNERAHRRSSKNIDDTERQNLKQNEDGDDTVKV